MRREPSARHPYGPQHPARCSGMVLAQPQPVWVGFHPLQTCLDGWGSCCRTCPRPAQCSKLLGILPNSTYRSWKEVLLDSTLKNVFIYFQFGARATSRYIYSLNYSQQAHCQIKDFYWKDLYSLKCIYSESKPLCISIYKYYTQICGEN